MAGAILQGLGSGAILALVGVGLVLVFKGSKVLNLAQGEIGAFALFVTFALTGHGAAPASGAIILVGTVVLAALLGIAMERTIMRPLVGRSPVQGTIASLGVAIVLINLELLLGKAEVLGGLPGFLPEGQNSFPVTIPPTVGSWNFSAFGATLASGQVVGLLLTAVAGIGLWQFFRRTRFGLAVVAATSDDTVARILGIPVTRVYRFTWGIGGALSGLAAALAAPFLQGFTPATMTFVLIGALAAAVIGGLDSVLGAIVGGLLVGLVQALVGFSSGGSAALGQVAVLVLVVGVLMIRPRGILGGAGVEL